MSQVQQQIETRTIPVSLLVEKRQDGQGKKIRGMPVVYNQWSNDMRWFRERIMPGAATEALKKSDPILNINHIDREMLAKVSSGTLRQKETPDGIEIEADPMESRQDVIEWLERGDVSKMSFRFIVKRDEWVYNHDDELDERTIHELEVIKDYALVTNDEGYSDTSVALRRRDEYRKLHPLEEDRKDEEEEQDDAGTGEDQGGDDEQRSDDDSAQSDDKDTTVPDLPEAEVRARRLRLIEISQ
jgi:HK97 family phage prohead protease